MKLLVGLILILLSTGVFAKKIAKKKLSRSEKIVSLINKEINTIKSIKKKSSTLMYRLFELESEKIKFLKEKENKAFIQSKIKRGSKVTRKKSFSQTLRHYKRTNAFGLNILKKYPKTSFKAAIYYTLALNSRDFAYDKKEKSHLINALHFAKKNSNIHYMASTTLAEFYYNNKNYKKAVILYQSITNNRDDEWLTKNLYNYGWCLLKTHKFVKAINTLEDSYLNGQDEYYVNLQDQVMTSLLSFYVIGKDIERGISFILKNSSNQNASLLKLAVKASGKGYFSEANKIVSLLERSLTPATTELYADFKLFQFNLYKDTHESEKMLFIAKSFPQIQFTPYQLEDAVRKLSDIVGTKQIILKKDFSKHEQTYSPSILNDIITYFSILASINTTERAQYEFFQAETYFSIEQFTDALKLYKMALESYDLIHTKKDIRKESMDAIFASLESIELTEKQEKVELKYAYHKYLTYWPSNKKTKSIYPRLYKIYLSDKDYTNSIITLNSYIKHFKSQGLEQKKLYTVYLDILIREIDTDRLSSSILLMSKGYLSFTKIEIKQSENILANLLFNQYQELNIQGKKDEALKGYQTVFFTRHYPKSIKADAAFNMGVIYTQMDKHSSAFKWYKKSLKLFSKEQKKRKRVLFAKMAKRTALLHNFVSASKMERFILRSYCYQKKKNIETYYSAVRNHLANDYIRKTLHTIKKYKKCIPSIPEDLHNEVITHLFQFNHESTLVSYIQDYKLESLFSTQIASYYEALYWRSIPTLPVKAGKIFNLVKKLNHKDSNNFLKATLALKKLRALAPIFIARPIPINRDMTPEKFNISLGLRLNGFKAVVAAADDILAIGHGKTSILAYDQLSKITKILANEIKNYKLDVEDLDFQKQFSTQMNMLAKNVEKQVKTYQKSSQKIQNKYEILSIGQTHSHLAFDLLKITDLRMPASTMAVTIDLEGK